MEFLFNALGLLLFAVLLVVIALRIKIGGLIAENDMLRGQLVEVRDKLEVLRDELLASLDDDSERIAHDFVKCSARAYQRIREKNDVLDSLKDSGGVDRD